MSPLRNRDKPPALRLATKDGARVGKTAKSKRLAAQPATDAARLMRSIRRIREEVEAVDARREGARKVLDSLMHAAMSDDPIAARALAREAHIECGFALNLNHLLFICEMAEKGALCA